MPFSDLSLHVTPMGYLDCWIADPDHEGWTDASEKRQARSRTAEPAGAGTAPTGGVRLRRAPSVRIASRRMPARPVRRS